MAKGKITEINPSGVYGIIEEEGTGDQVQFVRPSSFQDPNTEVEVGQTVNFNVNTNPQGMKVGPAFVVLLNV